MMVKQDDIKATITVNGEIFERIWFAVYQADPNNVQTLIGGVEQGDGETDSPPMVFATVLADLIRCIADKLSVEPMVLLGMLTLAVVNGDLPDDVVISGLVIASPGDDEDDDQLPPPQRLQ